MYIKTFGTANTKQVRNLESGRYFHAMCAEKKVIFWSIWPCCEKYRQHEINDLSQDKSDSMGPIIRWYCYITC